MEGITILSQPERISIDLVFIHGLHGHKTRSWTYPGSLRSWPEALLPHDFPDARILSWGYNASVSRLTTSASFLTGHALDLLQKLTTLRSNTRTEAVEIVFICHSLGGIVCKQLLVDSRGAPRIQARAICDLTLGIIFFGTPHKTGLLRTSLQGIITASTVDGRSTVFRDLSRQHDEFGRLQESFESLLQEKRYRAQPIEIATFVEADRSLPFRALPKQYAVLRDQQPSVVSGDHFSMIKFAESIDPSYKKFCQALTEIVKRSKPLRRATQEFSSQLNQRFSSQLNQQCLRSLWYSEMWASETAVSLAYPDTCNWIYDHLNYQRWYLDDVNDGSENLLWIKGNPGSGKSTLMKHMATKLRENRRYCFSFFFSRMGTCLQRSLAGCYRSLLYQMLDQLPECCETLIETFQEKQKSDVEIAGNTQWSLLELSQMFHTTICDISIAQKIYIFIDGIDECQEEDFRLLARSFLESMESFRRRGNTVYLCIASRQGQRYYHLSVLSVQDHLEILIEESDVEGDMERYLTDNLPREYRLYAADIARKSRGMFLWIVLVVRQLTDNPYMAIAEFLNIFEDLPRDLEELYIRVLCRQEHWTRKDVALVQCILAASQPLHRSMLCGILGIDQVEFSQLSSIMSGLFGLGPEHFIQPIHFTVRELFGHHRSLDAIGYQGSPSDFLRHGHRLLLSFCLDTLAAVRVSSNPPRLILRHVFARDRSTMGAVDKQSKSQAVMSNDEEYAIWHTFEHILSSDLLSSTPEPLAEAKVSRSRLHQALLGWSFLFEQQSFWENEQGHLLLGSASKVVAEYPTWFNLLPGDIELFRIHAVVESRGDTTPEVHSQYSNLKSLREVSAKEFWAINEGPEVKSDFAFLEVSTVWQLAGFVHRNFSSKQRIGDIFVIIGLPGSAQGLTCGEYVRYRWPSIGQQVLELLDKLRPETEAPQTKSLNKNIASDIEIEMNGLELRMMNWQGPDKLGELERASFNCRGPIEILLDFIEILAWLSAALRHAKASIEGLTISDVHAELLRQDGEPTLSCTLLPWFLKQAVKSQTSCWHDLFKRTVIVNSPKVQHEKNQATSFLRKLFPSSRTSKSLTETGLEIRLDWMKTLASADTLVNYEGGLVFLGYSTILVPVRCLGFRAIQWHLLAEEGNKRIALWRVNEEIPERTLIADEKTLRNASLHFLALWPQGKVVLGTEKLENARLQRLELGEKKFKIILQSLSFGLASGGFGYAGPSVGVTVAFAKSQLKCDPEKQKLPDLLIDFIKEPILLYDPHPSERRAWLVAKLSVLLHVVQLYVSTKGFPYEPPCAFPQADGGKAAWDALKGRVGEIVVSIGESEDNILRLSDLLKRISVNLRRMEKEPLNNGLYSRIIGYDFADLVSKPDVRLRKTQYAWTSNRQGWYFFTTKLPVLICRGLGDVIVPIVADDAQPAQPFEIGRDHLAAPIRCLQAICDDGLGDLNVGKLDSHWVWHSPHTPFGHCHCENNQGVEHARRPECDVTQYIVPHNHIHSRQWAQASTNEDGVILIGRYPGRRLQKRAQNQRQPVTDHKVLPIQHEDQVAAGPAVEIAHAAASPQENERSPEPQHPRALSVPVSPPANLDASPGIRKDGLPEENLAIQVGDRVQANRDIESMVNVIVEEDDPSIPILKRVPSKSFRGIFRRLVQNVMK